MLHSPRVAGAGPELRAGVLFDPRQGTDVIGVGVVADESLHRMQRDANLLDAALDQRGVLGSGAIQQDGALMGDDEIGREPFVPT
jgi:hypothetical protein